MVCCRKVALLMTFVILPFFLKCAKHFIPKKRSMNMVQLGTTFSVYFYFFTTTHCTVVQFYARFPLCLWEIFVYNSLKCIIGIVQNQVVLKERIAQNFVSFFVSCVWPRCKLKFNRRQSTSGFFFVWKMKLLPILSSQVLPHYP